jgi:hypothetical protein
VHVATEVRNSLDAPVLAKLVSEVVSRSGTVVATVEQEKEIAAKATVLFEPPALKVTGAELWSPNHPYLYTLRSRVYRWPIVISTHHYLHFIEPLRTAASERFATKGVVAGVLYFQLPHGAAVVVFEVISDISNADET